MRQREEKEMKKFVIECDDVREMELALASERMAMVLCDLLEWEHAIRNGKDYGRVRVLYKGNLYTESEYYKLKIPDEDRDEHGFVAGLKSVYTEDDVENILGDYLDEIRDLINRYYR